MKLLTASLISIVASSVLLTYPTRGFALDLDPKVTEVIVKLVRNSTDGISPQRVIDVIKARSTRSPADFQLYTRMSSADDARWLIDHRLPNDYIDLLRKVDPEHPELHLQEYIVLRYSDNWGMNRAEELLDRDPDVVSVRPNTMHNRSTRVNDYFVSQTNQNHIPAGYQWALEALRAMSPWNAPTALSGWNYARGFAYVGVVDTGVDTGHEDLQENTRYHFSQSFYSGQCVSPNNVLTDVDESGSQSVCQNTTARGHGTHIAGLIAAQPDNVYGVAGVCWHCSLIIAKGFVNNGLTDSTADLINGMNHSIIRGAQLINRSGGARNYLTKYGVGVSSCTQLQVGVDGFCDVLAFAVRREVVVVAAAGNGNNVKNNPGDAFATEFPAHDPRVVSVGGTIYGDTLWSNDVLLENGVNVIRGTNLDKVQFVAPAKRVVSTFYRGATWQSGYCNDLANNSTYPTSGVGYDECTGTSMSTPLVVGSIAIARSLNPLLTATAVVTAVTNSARTVAGSYKMPDLFAIATTITTPQGGWTPLFAMQAQKASEQGTVIHNRFYSVAPQMGSAAIFGTMLPTLNQSQTPVYYSVDTWAGAYNVPGYPQFPDWSYMTPRTRFYVYTKHLLGEVAMLPLYRLSKLQNVGNGFDKCGFPTTVPNKQIPVAHFYTTSLTERQQRSTPTTGNCFEYDGVEGYLAPSNVTGTLQPVYRLHHPANDHYALVTAAYVATFQAQGYTGTQSLLGYAMP